MGKKITRSRPSYLGDLKAMVSRGFKAHAERRGMKTHRYNASGRFPNPRPPIG